MESKLNRIKYFDLKKTRYLDLEISEKQIKRVSIDTFNDLVINGRILKIHRYLYNYYNYINPFLDKFNYQCRIFHIKKYLRCCQSICSFLNYFKNEKSYTTDYLNSIKYKSLLSNITFFICDGLENFNKYNCPNSLINMSIKIIIDTLFDSLIDNEFETINPINSYDLNIPTKFIKIINLNYNVNMSCLDSFKDGYQLKELCQGIEMIQNFIISEPIIKAYRFYTF